MSHDVAVLVYDSLEPFELGVVVEVFGVARPEVPELDYALTVCAAEVRPVSVAGGFTLVPRHGLEALDHADTVIVPGSPDVDADLPGELLESLRAAHQRGARMVSLCLGSFTLAAAGLLDGRTAATHWQFAERLASRYPRVHVDDRVLYVDDGQVLTSAGSAAGIDLCLHLVRRDHGSVVANALARRMVIAPHRDGGQAQFIEQPVPEQAEESRIADVITWALERLHARITVSDLAGAAFMSPRTFSRRFRQATGRSPGDWLLEQRVLATLPLLESTDSSVEEIATTVGFADAAALRYHFARLMDMRPSDYRRRFAV
jgi:AraC family transcriptional activator FtrA